MIVSTDKALHGIDESNGEIKWSNDLFAGLDVENYKEVDASPFISINTVERVGTVKTMVIRLLDPDNGQMLFDSKEAGITEMETEKFLYRSGTLVMMAKSRGDKKFSMRGYDLATGDMLWQNEKESSPIFAIMEISDTEFIATSTWNIFRINARTGEMVWKSAADKSMEQMPGGKLGGFMKGLSDAMARTMDVEYQVNLMRGQNAEVFYISYQYEDENRDGEMFTKSGYRAIRSKDGSQVWSQPYEYKGNLGLVAFHRQGMIILPREDERTVINMLSYQSGRPMWGKKGKGIRVKGSVLDYSFTSEGLLLTNGKLSRNGKRIKGSMNLLDVNTGEFMFKKFQKVNGRVLHSEVTPAGLLYITEKDVNIIDLETGDELLPKSISTDPGLQAVRGDIMYVFSDEGELYELNKTTGSSQIISKTSVKFEGKDNPRKLEMRNDGIFLSADQNFALYETDGSLKYHRYYPAPSENAWVRAMHYANVVNGAALTFYAGVATAFGGFATAVGDGIGADTTEEQEFTDVAKQITGLSARFVGKSMKRANARLENTKTAKDFAFVVTKDPIKGFRLVQVEKSSGEIKESIDMDKDRKPSYEVDIVLNQVYYQYDSDAIACYGFN